MNYNKYLDQITRKKPNHGNGLRLDKSERVFPIPQYLWSKFKDSLTEEDFSLYPNPQSLINKLATFHKVKPENICLNFGSDSSIKSIFEIFCKPGGNVITSDPCFPMYEIYAKEFQCELKGVKYKQDEKTLQPELYLKDIIQNLDKNTNLIVLANPNSPVGDFKDEFWFRSLLSKISLNIPVLIDEAYFEFSNKEEFDLIKYYPNLIITRTFSKALGAAGCRLGYTIAQPEVIQILEKIKPTFEITGPSLKYAEFILDNYNEIVIPYVELVNKEKNDLCYTLGASGFEVINGYGNWIHFNKGDNEESIKILNTFNIEFKSGLSLPFKEGNNWIRISIVPGFKYSLAFKELLNEENK